MLIELYHDLYITKLHTYTQTNTFNQQPDTPEPHIHRDYVSALVILVITKITLSLLGALTGEILDADSLCELE